MEKEIEREKKHTLSALTRGRVSITGVCEVESFDDRTVMLTTDCGRLTLEGEGLRIGTLDMERGLVEVDGRLDGLFYTDEATERKGGRRRLFG